ncbi:MAG TPA: ATP-binding cassette domain-containing protein [Candidatus Dormibacteraeota bacterium]|jgi:alpha-D-ribose 1-methylphosphonate 5-triphosphate synthase subunit PhnL|nr:ATP-binding cassette domain-containing protein [Candidatus Dormibacteraeota bacterium]
MTLEIRELRKSFTQHALGRRIDVLEGVSLSVAPGECVVLSGPSGSGKTTLLRCVYGQALPDAGSIRIEAGGEEREMVGAGPSTVLAARRRLVGLATQFLDVVPRVPALELLRQRGQERAAAGRLLSRLGLAEELHDMPPATFSGGQRQIVNLALALSSRRPLLLLDEVTASLDPARRRAALELIQERKQEGVAMLAVFHDVPTQSGLVDRVLTVRQGQLVAA